MDPQWKKQMCPLLTAGVLTPPSALVSSSGQQPARNITVQPCVGPDCAFFMRLKDDRGTTVAGGCAVPIAASAVGNVAGLVQMAIVGSQQQPAAPAAVIPDKKV